MGGWVGERGKQLLVIQRGKISLSPWPKEKKRYNKFLPWRKKYKILLPQEIRK